MCSVRCRRNVDTSLEHGTGPVGDSPPCTVQDEKAQNVWGHRSAFVIVSNHDPISAADNRNVAGTLSLMWGKLARCHRTTVSGVTTISDCLHPDHSRRTATQKRLSNGPILGLGCRRFSTTSCWRSARSRGEGSDAPVKRRSSVRRHRTTNRTMGRSYNRTAAETRQVLLIFKSARVLANHTCSYGKIPLKTARSHYPTQGSDDFARGSGLGPHLQNLIRNRNPCKRVNAFLLFRRENALPLELPLSDCNGADIQQPV